MMLRKISAMLCLLPVIAAAGDMLQLKGLRPGIAKSDLQQYMPALTCVPDPAVRARSECSYVRTDVHQGDINALDSLGGELVEGWELRFHDDVLGQIVVFFDRAAFDRITSALRSDFGEPTNKATHTLYDRKGARVMSREFTWRRDGETLVATEFAGRKGMSVVRLASDNRK